MIDYNEKRAALRPYASQGVIRQPITNIRQLKLA